MGFKKTLFYRLLTGVFATFLACSPLMVQATESTESQLAYAKTIESNSWDHWPMGPAVYAQSAIVMEADTGMILYAKDMEAKHYPASITKIMTALVTLDHCELNEEIEYSYHATHSIEYGSSSIARTEGEILTVEESLYALMLASANECANALAEHIAGSIEEFAVLMNEKAKELGCVNTHFSNANGLHDENHYTCAYDMALITKAALENEDFRRISGEDYYTLRATNKNDEQLLIQNHHYMISSYRTNKYLDDTIFSGKTGYTTDALNTLVTCGRRNDMDIIVVTMRTQSTAERGVPLFTDTAALLEYANNFQRLNISDHETTFVVGNAYDFSIDTEELNSSGSLISINEDSCVILPNSVNFEDAVPSITFEEIDGKSKAYLTYEFAGQCVGKASISLEESKEEDFNFSETESAGETSSQNGPRFIAINVMLIFMILIGITAFVFVIFVIYRIYKKNLTKIRKSMNIYQKRRSLSRNRYRRRKSKWKRK